jgi:hypothetical protein
MHFTEAKGPSLKKDRERELEHLRILAHPEATQKEPAWLVEHHFASPAHKPEAHEFSNHDEMIEHVRTHSGVEPVEGER